ncbi:MAG: hypothetical protein ACRBCK_07955 [Alphaproteobacteria bacterium]
MEMKLLRHDRVILICIIVLMLVHSAYTSVFSYMGYYTDEGNDAFYHYLSLFLLIYYSIIVGAGKNWGVDRGMLVWMLFPFSLFYVHIKNYGIVKGVVFSLGLFITLYVPFLCDVIITYYVL